MTSTIKTILSATTALGLLAAAAAADSVKIAYIDPLSGPFAPVGDQGLKHFQFMADRINAAGGVAGGKMLEILPFDNRTAPDEALIQMNRAIDQGARLIAQGNGSSVAAAISQAVERHNRRNPDDPVLYLNYAAVDPILTNDRCHFWHFRFDADADMKMEALTDWIVTQEDVKKVYVLGQDYSFGQAVGRAAEEMINRKRPDIEIVGNELHPLGRVQDFTPYTQKMRRAGADLVITGNWGTDMTLLIRAASDTGHNVPYLTYYGGGLGAPTAMGQAAVGLVKQITEWHENVAENDEGMVELMDAFEEKYGADFYFYRVKTMFEMLARAMDETGETDPLSIAMALRGMEHETELGTVYMRDDNHQLIQPLYISTFSDDVERDVENLGLGFKTDYRIEGEATHLDTTCQMNLPG